MTTPLPITTPDQEIGASTDSARHGHSLSPVERALCGVLGEECEVWGLACAAYGVPAKAAPPATPYQAGSLTRGGNPIFFPQRSREGLSQTETPGQAKDDARSSSEPLNDTTARKKRVVRKTPPPPINTGSPSDDTGTSSGEDRVRDRDGLAESEGVPLLA